MLRSAEADLAGKMAPLAEKISRIAKDLNGALLADKADAGVKKKLADDLANAVSGLAAEARFGCGYRRSERLSIRSRRSRKVCCGRNSTNLALTRICLT